MFGEYVVDEVGLCGLLVSVVIWGKFVNMCVMLKM